MKLQRLEESPAANNKFGKLSVSAGEDCIGCGVCVYTCPVEALSLERCETTEHPPKDVGEFAKRHLTDVMAALARGAQDGTGEPQASRTASVSSTAGRSRAST